MDPLEKRDEIRASNARLAFRAALALVRPEQQIRREIESLASRRIDLYLAMGCGVGDTMLRDEVAQIGSRLSWLWEELRTARMRPLVGA